MTKESGRIVGEFYEASTQKDLAHLEQLLTEDAVWEMPFALGGPSTSVGRAAVLATFEQAFANLATLSFEDVRIMPAVEEGLVFVECRGTSVAVSGQSYHNRYIEVFRVRDGRICLVREYFDPIVLAKTFNIPIA